MSLTLVAAATREVLNVHDVTFDLSGVGLQDGDTMIGFVGLADTVTGSPIIPPGWTELFIDEQGTGPDRAAAAAYDVWETGDPTSIFWDFPDASQKTGIVLVYRDLGVFDVFDWVQEVSASNSTTPPITPTDNALVVSWYWHRINAGTYDTPSAGFTPVADIVGGSQFMGAASLEVSAGLVSPGEWAFTTQTDGGEYRMTTAFLLVGEPPPPDVDGFGPGRIRSPRYGVTRMSR